MLSALILAGLFVNQVPPLTDEEAAQAARVLIDAFDLEVELRGFERHPEPESFGIEVTFQGAGEAVYGVWVDGRTGTATTINSKDAFDWSGTVPGEATTEEIAYALGVIRKTHPGYSVGFGTSDVDVRPTGEARVGVRGEILFNGKPLYVGTGFYIHLSRGPVTFYMPVSANYVFDRASRGLSHHALADTNYVVEKKSPVVTVRDIRAAAKERVEAHLKGREEAYGTKIARAPIYSIPQVIQLVIPGERKGTQCYFVKVTYMVDSPRPDHRHSLYFDGQTGEYLPSGYID